MAFLPSFLTPVVGGWISGAIIGRFGVFSITYILVFSIVLILSTSISTYLTVDWWYVMSRMILVVISEFVGWVLRMLCSRIWTGYYRLVALPMENGHSGRNVNLTSIIVLAFAYIFLGIYEAVLSSVFAFPLIEIPLGVGLVIIMVIGGLLIYSMDLGEKVPGKKIPTGSNRDRIRQRIKCGLVSQWGLTLIGLLLVFFSLFFRYINVLIGPNLEDFYVMLIAWGILAVYVAIVFIISLAARFNVRGTGKAGWGLGVGDAGTTCP
ncbi:MAG: hypothetical protein ACTSUE_09570 [Promethearchaeota archaeon]